MSGGPAELGVTFVAQPQILSTKKREPYDASFNRHRHPRQSPALYQISIVGPIKLEKAEPFGILRETGLSPQHQRAAAEKVLRPLMRRAYRRDVTEEDMARPMVFFDEASEEGFQAGMEAALSAVLVSPRFLFRIENDPPGLPSGDDLSAG